MDQNEENTDSVLSTYPDRCAGSDTAYCFGTFTLIPRQRLLLNNDQPVSIGNRALCLLSALVMRPGEVLEKDELLALVWPRLVVEECNLRAQVVALRRVLGADSSTGYVLTIPGRGYRFVTPVTVRKHQGESTFAPSRVATLPPPGRDVIGRQALIDALGVQLLERRCLTLTGPGGIGKSTVALTLANQHAAAFAQGVCFVDLASVTAAQQVPELLAMALGIQCASGDPLSAVAERLGQARLLLLLDSCEHVLDSVAALVERFLRDVPNSCVLVTSREPLRAAGESVHRLAPLEAPLERHQDLSASQALRYSAVQLFVERATSDAADFIFSNAEVRAVSAICRKLDNNPLAIELAAARVRTFGLTALVDLLDGRLRLQMSGRRNGAERHQSLGACLDWSYRHLSVAEQHLLRQLSVLPGSFTLEAVAAMVEDGHDVLSVLESLVDKSLLVPLGSPAAQRYHLLEVTRAYALEQLAGHGEVAVAQRRRAVYALRVMREACACLNSLSSAHWLALYGPEVELVRRTFAWAFTPGGDPDLAAELKTLSVPLWLHLSLPVESQQWSGRARGYPRPAPPLAYDHLDHYAVSA